MVNVQRYSMECTNDGCGTRPVVGQRIKGSEWWNGRTGWGGGRNEKSI